MHAPQTLGFILSCLPFFLLYYLPSPSPNPNFLAALAILFMFCQTLQDPQSIAGEPPRNSTEQQSSKLRVHGIT